MQSGFCAVGTIPFSARRSQSSLLKDVVLCLSGGCAMLRSGCHYREDNETSFARQLLANDGGLRAPSRDELRGRARQRAASSAPQMTALAYRFPASRRLSPRSAPVVPLRFPLRPQLIPRVPQLTFELPPAIWKGLNVSQQAKTCSRVAVILRRK